MARDDGEKSGKRRWGRGGKPEEGPSEEELGWLADLRGAGRDDRGRGRDDLAGGPPRRGASPGSPAGPTPGPAAGPAGRSIRSREKPPPPPPPSSPAPPPAPSRWGLRRTPATPPPPPPPVSPPPVSPPAPAGRTGGPRPMMDWSDLTGELPSVTEPPARTTDSRGRAGRTGDLRTGDLRTGDMRTGDVRTGDLRTGDVRAAPAARPAAPDLLRGGLRPGMAPPIPAGPPPAGPGGLGPAGLGGLGPAGPGPAGPPPPGIPGPARDLMVTTGMIKRAELRKHLRIQQQLKVGTLALVALLLLAAYPIYLFTTAVARDPVFTALDDLDLPEWARYEHSDFATGSRWCIDQCRFRTRTWASERSPEETSDAFFAALQADGWRIRTGTFCPQVAEGVMTCWKKDEYVMDMWSRAPLCEVPPPRPTIAATGPTTAPTQPAEPNARVCPHALVTMEVRNAIDYGTAMGTVGSGVDGAEQRTPA